MDQEDPTHGDSHDEYFTNRTFPVVPIEASGAGGIDDEVFEAAEPFMNAVDQVISQYTIRELDTTDFPSVYIKIMDATHDWNAACQDYKDGQNSWDYEIGLAVPEEALRGAQRELMRLFAQGKNVCDGILSTSTSDPTGAGLPQSMSRGQNFHSFLNRRYR